MIYADDLPSTVTEAEARKLAELARDGMVLEMGSWYGRSTVAMASTAKRVHAVDWHHGDAQAGRAETLEPFLTALDWYEVRERVVVHIGRFEDVVPAFRANFFDFVFLDGYHEQDAVARDLKMARRVVKSGGAIACHDYGLYGVAPAVDSFGTPELTDTLAVLRG